MREERMRKNAVGGLRQDRDQQSMWAWGGSGCGMGHVVHSVLLASAWHNGSSQGQNRAIRCQEVQHLIDRWREG